jgi:hypothetical protein
MKKTVIVIVGLILLLYLVFKSRPAQDMAEQFIQSNETHERKLLQEFLSQ